jgi:hypothetical protein
MIGAALRWVFPLLLLMAVWGCANIVPPTGGDKDERPPVLLRVTPPDSQLNVRPKKIEFYFDEYIVLSEAAAQVQISPMLSVPLTVSSSLKRVTVVIPDSLLQEETTYRITFGTAIRDLHEGNIYNSNGYTFSTGAHFDSLSLVGSVFDARTGLKDSAAHVLLYAMAAGDSAIVKRKPMYVVHTDAAGNFRFQGLPSRPFRIYALRDANNNLTFDGGQEWIAFHDSIVTPGVNDTTDIILRTFPESLGDTTAPNTGSVRNGGLSAAGFRPVTRTESVAPGSYTLSVDTSDIKRRTQDLDEPIILSVGRKLGEDINEAKIFLSHDSGGTIIEDFVQVKEDSSGLQYTLSTTWQEDAVYTLRLQKGFGKDSTGADLLPGRYTFRTKRDEDYGKLRIHLPTRFYGKNHILQVSNERDTIYQKPVSDTIVNLQRIPPGVYTVRVIEDKNMNGRWDAGDLFLRRQAEYVFPYNNTINLKAGWEQQIDFEEPRKRSLGEASDRPGQSR